MTGSGRRVTTAIAAIGFVALAAACGASGASPAAPHVGSGAQLDRPLPAAIRHMTFTDETGRPVRLSDFTGKTIVLDDVLTLCQEHCPIDTAVFVQTALRYSQTAPDPGDVVFLSITVDPGRDTPAQLAAYRRLYVGGEAHLPQWHLLTAAPAELTRLWHLLHVYAQKVGEDGGVVRNWRTGQRLTYDVDHSDVVYVIDQHDTERYLFDGQPYLHGATIPPQMQKFMSAEGRRNQNRGSWTSSQALQILAWVTHRPA